MKHLLTILFLLCLCTLNAAGQGITRQKCAICGKLKVQCPGHEKTCTSCGKVISKCPYKGNHPVEKKCPTCGKPLSKCPGHEAKCRSCGKVISKCPYNGKHPSKPSINATNNATSNAPSGYENGHEWVDLGLSVKWATCNVGASTPTDYGSYFAWGETRTKSDYSWSTYFDTNDGGSTFLKYATNKKTNLDLSDDAAYANWGGNWRMPTVAEQNELRDKCSWTWTTLNGVKGYKVSSKRNSNSIFLPAAGSRYEGSLNGAGSCGGCWSSSLSTSLSGYASYLDFDSGRVSWSYGSHFYGQSVRAVCP